MISSTASTKPQVQSIRRSHRCRALQNTRFELATETLALLVRSSAQKSSLHRVPDVEKTLNSNFGWSDGSVEVRTSSRELMYEAFLGVAPKPFVHGHYHVAGEARFQLDDRGHETSIWSLACNGMDGNLRPLDLESPVIAC